MADKTVENNISNSFERSVFTEFFTMVEKDCKNVRVRCKLCPPAVKQTYSCAINSTANLKKHLEVSKIYTLLQFVTTKHD